MPTTFIRGANPVWSFVDLDGLQFDDTYYMYVLQNEIPYIPATVWHDNSGNVPWTDPIQFLANGTLPIDIFWDPNVVYRLEFRHNLGIDPPSQADPLIYLVEDYVPGSGGSSPIDAIGIFTENQMTNPQFSIVNFNTPFILTNVTDPDPIEVGPGWFLVLEGTGNVTLEVTPLNAALENPTNAPYALHVELSGNWTGNPTLRQRFSQNGMLWSGKYVSSSVTARIQGSPQEISARLVDSMGTVLASVLSPVVVDSAFNEFSDYGLVPDTTNSDLPPAAWVDYELLLPTDVDIYLTSFQVIASAIPTAFPYEQDTIDRQDDHTWHYYRNDVVVKPKDTILTAWNFSLNPYQFVTPTVTTVVTQTDYIADQTILHQISAGSSLQSGKASVADRECLLIKAVAGQTVNQFALIQYVDASTIKPYWSYLLSSLARARIFTTHGTEVGIKMRLIYRASVPPQISATEPIASWTGADPTFAAGWTALAPRNDPEYILPNAYASGEGDDAFPAFPFEAFEMPTMTNTNMSLGIVIYTTGNIDSSMGTEDSIAFDRISLVPNAFAVDSNPQTYDQVLSQCRYFFEKSYDVNVLAGSVSLLGVHTIQQNIGVSGGNSGIRLTNLYFDYLPKRVKPTNTRFAIYSPTTGAVDNVLATLYSGAGVVTFGDIPFAANFAELQIGQSRASFVAQSGTVFQQAATGGLTNPWSGINFHSIVDVRLGTGI